MNEETVKIIIGLASGKEVETEITREKYELFMDNVNSGVHLAITDELRINCKNIEYVIKYDATNFTRRYSDNIEINPLRVGAYVTVHKSPLI